MNKTITLPLLFFTFFLSNITNAQQASTALDFDGINDYVDLGSSVATGLRTIEMWFKPNTTIDNSNSVFISLIARNDSSQIDEFYLYFSSLASDEGKLTFGRNSSTITGAASINSDNNIWNANTWYHVAGVFDPVNGLALYINGVKQSETNPNTGAPGARPEITALGRWGDLNIRHFNGQLDEVRLWDRALSQDEIRNSLNVTLTGSESGLVAYYDFEEGIPNGDNSAAGGDITQVIDQAGSNNGSVINFTRNGSSSNWVTGKAFSEGNTALDFDGNGDYIEAPHASSLNLNDFTLEAWVKTTSTSSLGRIVSKPLGSVQNYSLLVDNGSVFVVFDNGSSGQFLSSNSTVNDGNWHHIVGVRSSSDNLLQIYIDGILDNSVTTTGTPITGTGPLSIGWFSSSFPSEIYSGQMDEVRVWNRALTLDEIQCNIDKPLVGSETGLVAYYDFEEGVELGNNSSLTKVFDIAGGNDGTLNGFAKMGIGSNWVDGTDALRDGASNTWLGGTTDWATASNWSYNAIPTECDSVLVPDVPNQPIIGSATTAVAGSLRLESNTELSVDGVLQVGNSITNDGSIIFKSTASGSGQLDVFGGTITGSGTITSERFMSTNRAYRFVTSPVGGSQTIREAWQEGASTGDLNPNPGFGTHITGAQGTVGNVAANGFDETSTGNPSLYTFNNTQQFYEPVTSTNVPLQAGTAYALFKRGDRSVNLLDNLADGETTLRATGALLTGPKSSGTDFPALSTAVQGFSLVPNPYQARVDFNALSFSGGVNPNFLYVFDPSAPNFGDFVVLENPTDAGDMFIHPGQSFFVVNDTDPLNISTPAITFNEDDKATGATPTTTVFSELARANLELYNANNQRLDMVKFRIEENASNGADNFDALKMFNTGENVGTLINNQVYEIERRPIPGQNEIIPLYTDNYHGTVFEFRLVTGNWDPSIDFFIQDNYLNTTTPIDDLQPYAFTVDSNIPESIDSDRFSLVFDNTTLGLEENMFGENFKLYPNPTSDGLFSITSSTLTGEVQIEIHDVLGKKVWSQTKDIIGNELRINAQELNNGVYLISLYQGEKSHTTKLIVN